MEFNIASQKRDFRLICKSFTRKVEDRKRWIRHSTQAGYYPWLQQSVLHVALKPRGEVGVPMVTTEVNESTVFDCYPVPWIHDFTKNLGRKTIFSKVDLISRCHQIPIHPDNIPKTAIISPFGQFEFLRMPFGLKNAAQAFQSLVDMVCANLDFVFV